MSIPLKNRTVFITGASRGIGREIALHCAKEGANIVIAAKSTEENPKLGGTIYSVAMEVQALGAKALPVKLDVRFSEEIDAAIQKTVETFGGIDILVNNASAISLMGLEDLPIKAFDLMNAINVRGTYMVTRACIPYLKKGKNPHILILSPPLQMEAKWFANHVAYTATKMTMSMFAMGISEELRKYKIACNTLWPLTIISTSAVKNLLGGQRAIDRSRTPAIMADAAVAIFKRNSSSCTGNFFIDQQVLEEEGMSDFAAYSTSPNHRNLKLIPDLFVPENLIASKL